VNVDVRTNFHVQAAGFYAMLVIFLILHQRYDCASIYIVVTAKTFE